MKALQSSIYIDAPVHIIWSIVTQLETYPEWNPLIEIATKHPLESGNKATFTLPFAPLLKAHRATIDALSKWKCFSIGSEQDDQQESAFTYTTELQKVNDHQVRCVIKIELNEASNLFSNNISVNDIEEKIRKATLALQSRAEQFNGCVG